MKIIYTGVDNVLNVTLLSAPKKLTIGKWYKTLESVSEHYMHVVLSNKYYHIENDDGVKCLYPAYYFKTLDEVRNEKLSILLSKIN